MTNPIKKTFNKIKVSIDNYGHELVRANSFKSQDNSLKPRGKT